MLKSSHGAEERLVVVSNRVPSLTADTADGTETSNPVGGLVSALHPAMAEQGGMWFGWSGRTTQRRPNPSPTISQIGPVQLATVDLSEDDVSLYYTGFSNRTLWPLLHSFQDRVQIRHDTYRAYRRINRRFAEALYQLLGPDDLVWVHDYHLFDVGEALRQVGWRGKTGFFLHVPFPPTEIFSMLPWTRQILEGLLRYDVVGVQTERYLHNLIDTLDTELSGAFVDGAYVRDGKSTKLGVYRIGIEPASFERPADAVGRSLADRLSLQSSPDHKTIVGVDRLDYTKGIPERLRAFERLLERVPALRGRVTLVQITAPSRTRVPEYNSEKERVERLVGQINGRFSEAEWVPIRYLYRSYPHSDLARLYRESDVCMVTPLRDGMNLVAKEFIASQGDDPGVLVLSKFCGAADSMEEALQVNPYDIDGTAEVTHEALRMPAPERRRRWKALMKGVRQDTAQAWSHAFRSDLAN